MAKIPGQGDLFGGLPPPRPPKRDLKRSRAARDEGIESVAGNNAEWMLAGYAVIRSLPIGWQGIAEDWREIMQERNLLPLDEHAWGALTTSAIKAGLLRATGERRSMRDPRSHARKSDVYERT